MRDVSGELLPDLSTLSLLAIFAHPDDESLACGGLLARCSEGGAHVSLLCLTRGEHGPGSTGEPLADVRTREVMEAARVLGIHDVRLCGHEDGMLPWIEAPILEADVLGAIDRSEPDVVITFDEDGLYWHPDHIAVHERTTAVVARLGGAAPALRYVSMPGGVMRAVAEAAANDRACGDEPLGPLLGVENVDAFGGYGTAHPPPSSAPTPDLIVDAGPFAERKVAALRCHRTQVEGTALDCLDVAVAARLLKTEHYRSAEVGARGDSFLERLGVPLAASGQAR